MLRPRALAGQPRTTEELHVHVTEPPLAGRPPGYSLGDVGHFALARAGAATATSSRAARSAFTSSSPGPGTSRRHHCRRRAKGWSGSTPEVHERARAGRARCVRRKAVVRLLSCASRQPGNVDLGEHRLAVLGPEQKRYDVRARAARGRARDCRPGRRSRCRYGRAHLLACRRSATCSRARASAAATPTTRRLFWLLGVGAWPLAFGIAVGGAPPVVACARAWQDAAARRRTTEGEGRAARMRVRGEGRARGRRGDRRAPSRPPPWRTPASACAPPWAARSSIGWSAPRRSRRGRGVAELLRECEAAAFLSRRDRRRRRPRPLDRRPGRHPGYGEERMNRRLLRPSSPRWRERPSIARWTLGGGGLRSLSFCLAGRCRSASRPARAARRPRATIRRALFATASKALHEGRAGDAIGAFETLADGGVVDAVASYDRGLAYALRVRIGARCRGIWAAPRRGSRRPRPVARSRADRRRRARAGRGPRRDGAPASAGGEPVEVDRVALSGGRSRPSARGLVGAGGRCSRRRLRRGSSRAYRVASTDSHRRGSGRVDRRPALAVAVGMTLAARHDRWSLREAWWWPPARESTRSRRARPCLARRPCPKARASDRGVKGGIDHAFASARSTPGCLRVHSADVPDRRIGTMRRLPGASPRSWPPGSPLRPPGWPRFRST